jgi:two-component system sensor histidine kinase KdpD
MRMIVWHGVGPEGVGRMARDDERPDPDALLARIKAQETPARGRLRIYLGSAPGVGKTYEMLQEGRRRKERGTDIVIGIVETHGRPQTAKQIGDLEIVPPREIPYKGVTLREMDTDRVIARRPRVALVDELAHTNAPGSRHEKRYEDVEDILDAGIDVISTLNIQHIESLNDTVEQFSGVAVHETVPDWVLNEAAQVELIDITPEALIQRMKHGNIYPPEQARRALDNFFTPQNLTALRELALRATAKEVEEDLDRYMREGGRAELAPVVEQVMVAVDYRASDKALIRRGWRLAAALKAGLVVVTVEPERGPRAAQTIEQERQLRTSLQLADDLGATVARLRGKVSDELVAYARARGVTHVVIGHPTHSLWYEILHGSVTRDLLRKLPGVDIHVYADRGGDRRKDKDKERDKDDGARQ